MLAVVETHPIQYHAPVYSCLQASMGVPVTAVYGSDCSVAGYHDRELNSTFAWDADLLNGYDSVFLSSVRQGGARDERAVSTIGLRGVLERIAPQAVLLVAYQPRFHASAFQHSRRLRLPLMFRGETTDHAVERHWLKRAARDLWLRRLYRDCHALLYVGQRSREHFTRLRVPGDRLFFSPYCVATDPMRTSEADRAEMRAATRRDLGFGPNDIVLLFCGKLSPRKAPQHLVEAVRRFPPDLRQRCKVLIVGDGELRGELRFAAASAPSVQMQLVGFKTQHALSRYYHASDVLVLPSLRSETWGLVVNEALHHGLPVVVSDQVGCAPDLVRSDSVGRIYQAGSIDALAAALVQVLPLVGEAKTRTACRAAVSDYTVTRAAEGIAAAFRMVTRVSSS